MSDTKIVKYARYADNGQHGTKEELFNRLIKELLEDHFPMKTYESLEGVAPDPRYTGIPVREVRITFELVPSEDEPAHNG